MSMLHGSSYLLRCPEEDEAEASNSRKTNIVADI